ncbi:unnamed protein product [Zymoseptoria tritici ST99CH_1A5]|uniref:Uncharacterized protein n=1 Tax=Zymoseptoria tritici ST99CH_1A5 TaxID=1276529 RepID=A0A1Y6LJ16_ZYMTR|nr:unnamed protein product [Zymoseptoria tritici ST99CH_1A5]
MANYAPENSVWSAMSYTPPRGRCNHKPGYLSTCPCLRFMLHPVKAATSFECDGCGHHASYHSMDNPEEDAILQKWSDQQKLQQQQQIANEAATGAGAKNKRRRIADKPADAEFQVLELLDDDDEDPVATTATQRVKQRQTVKLKPTSSKRFG